MTIIMRRRVAAPIEHDSAYHRHGGTLFRMALYSRLSTVASGQSRELVAAMMQRCFLWH